jgi:hypothetical protein
MNESHQKLYDLLIDQKLYSKSYDEFTSQFEDEEKQQKLYDLIQQQNLYSKSYDDFTQQFFSQKKKDGPSESDASPFGGSEPGDLSWSLQKFAFGFSRYGAPTRAAMEGVEMGLMEAGALEDFNRYDFGDFDADQFTSQAQQQSELHSVDIHALLGKDQDFLDGLARIESKKAGDEVVARSGFMSTKEGLGASGRVETRRLTEQDIEKERIQYISNAYNSKLTEFNQGSLKDEILSQLSPEQKADKEFLSALSDKLYYHAGVNADLDGDGRYNDQPLVQDMVNAFDTSSRALVDGLSVPIMMATMEEEELKEAFADMNKTDELRGRLQTQYDNGITDSYANGDIVNGTKQLLTGMAGAAPSIMVSTTGLGGALALGTSGGFKAWSEVAYDESFTNDMGKYGYAIANGVGDFAFARIGTSIFKGAEQAALKSYTTAALAKRNGQLLTMDMVKGYGYRKGLAFTSEFLEEAATELTTSYFRAVGKGEKFDLASEISNVIDAGLIGGFAGVSIDTVGNTSGRIKAASNARANAAAETQRQLEAQKAELQKKLAGYATGDPRVQDLQAEISRIESDIESLVRGRQDFYTMMSARHEGDFEKMQLLDAEIERLNKAANEATTEEEKGVLKERMTAAIKQRLEIQQAHIDEDATLTQEESDLMFRRSLKDGLAAIDDEVEKARNAVTILRDRLGTQDPPSQSALDTAEKALQDEIGKRKTVQQLMGQLDQARAEARSARAEAATEGGDIEAFNEAMENVVLLEEALAEVAGVDSKIVSGPSRFVGDLLDINAQIANRATPEWTEANIDAMQSSSLTREQIEGILASENYAMITAENPNNRAVSDESNVGNNKKAEEYLKKLGLKYHKIVGRYDNGENSFLVEGMTREQAAEFARQFNQESVAHRDGLVLRDGSMNAFEEGVSFDESFDNYFSAMKDSDGNVVRFSKSPSDKFVDKDGNEISKEDFEGRIKDLESNLQAIEDYIVEKAKEAEQKVEEQKTTVDQKTGLPEGALTVNPKAGIKVGDGGVLNKNEARTINNLFKLFQSLYGADARMVLMPEGSQDYMGEGTGGLFFEVKDGVPTIFVSASQVRVNAASEAAQAKEQGVKYRTKSFAETVVEEVGHAAIGPGFQQLTDGQQQAMERRALEIAGKAKDGGALLNRLLAKKDTYQSEGKDPREVREEVVIDLISALSGGSSSVSLGIADSVMRLFNEILVKAGMAKDMRLSDPNSIFRVAAQLNVARKTGATFSADTKANPSNGPKASGVVRPLGLKPGEDGKVTVTMLEPIFSWKNGIKKDIGSKRVTKKFNDKYHFINWWKKVTEFGADLHYSKFQTEDGTPIDTGVIKRKSASRGKPSTDVVNMSLEVYKERVLEAQKQGLIDDAAKRMMLNNYYKVKRRYNSDKDSYGLSYESYVQNMNDKAEEMFKSASERTGIGFDFEPDSPQGKASYALKLDLRKRGAYESFEAKAKFMEARFGIRYDAGNKALTRMFHSSVAKDEYGIDYDNQSEAEVTKRTKDALVGLMRSYYGSVGARVKVFSSDPIEFFKKDKEQAEMDVDNMLRSMGGVIDSSQEGFFAAYQFVKSFTSVGNKAKPNIDLAKQVMLESARWRDSGGETYIDPRIIQDIRDGSDASGVDVKGVPGKTRKTIAKNLEKFNVELTKYQNEDGTYKLVEFLDAMNQVDGDSQMSLEFPSEATPKRFVAQRVFSEKVGAFALNLNGNNDALTIDSHMGRTLLQLLGRYNTVENIMDRYRGPLAEITGIEPDFVDPVTGQLDDFKLAEYDQKIIDKAGELALRSEEQLQRKIERMLENITGEDKAIPVEYKQRRVMENVIAQAAMEMDMSIAEFTQLLFADGQVMKGANDFRPAAYNDFASAAIQSRFEEDLSLTEKREARLERLVVHANNIAAAEGVNRNNTKRMLESDEGQTITAEAEAKASMHLSLPFNKSQNAEDSSLYRKRSPEEALTVKPGMVLNDRKAMDALGTDATSRRIIGKNSQITEGQQVGIRLNLNVMKNTGVPVQTMHDKNATGEALKYAAVVTVKNPVLAVNQNARRKILSFQENKFPMASVNGGFLTDKISESSFDGVKAFFNPFKHNVFVDAQGRPIKSAGEATIVGNTVYLRGDIEYYDYNDPILKEGRTESPDQKAKRTERGPKYDKALKRFKAYSEKVLGLQYANDADLQEAYDNMTFTSQVALDESDAASRAEEAVSRASSKVVMRRFAGNAARKYSGVREDILNDPRNYFAKQSIAREKENLSNMSDQELIDIMTDDALGRLQSRNDDMGVLASAEMIKRAVARGDVDAIPGIVAEAAAMGTTAGRLLRHFRELKNSTPKGLIETLRKEIELRGRTLNESQEKKLTGIASELFRLQAEVEELVKKGAQGEDVDADLNAKVAELKEAERNMDAFANAMIERNWNEIGSMLIQGNLLTPMSQVTNVGANIINAIGQIGVDLVAYPVEKLIKIFDKNSDPVRRPSFSAYMYGVRKFGGGFIEALNEVVTGQGQDVTEWRVNRGFMPFRSLIAAASKDSLPLMMKGEPRVIDSQFVKLLVQGTIGIPAEIMFRLLSLGDTPFRRMFEGIDLYEQATELGLEGEARENFIKYPGKRAKQAAESRGRRITFQEETMASRAADDGVRILEKLIDTIPGMDGKFLVRTFIPYRRTPANILYESLTFAAPPVAIARAMNAISEGDSKEASQNIGKAIVGGMASYTAMALLKEGLLSGPIDYGDDEEKNLMYDQFPPNSINVTGLQRLMDGGDPSKQPDDYFISYNKLGIIGAIFGSVAKATSREELKERGDEPMVTHMIADAFGVKAFSTMSYMMDQSFLQGVQGLTGILSAAGEAEFERAAESWFKSTWQATTATALPNTLSAMYRSHREYLPDTRVTKDMGVRDRIVEAGKFIVLDRTFGLGNVPVRVDWKGNPIKQTPRGANGYMYQLFDITKARQGQADLVSNEMYRLFEQTEELPRALGTPRFASTSSLSVPGILKPRDKFSAKRSGVYFEWMEDEDFMKEKVRLNTTQINRMMSVAGKARYKELEDLMSKKRYIDASDEDKIDMLDDLNRTYSKSWAYNGNRLAPHTAELCRILNEIYEGRKEED